MGFKDDAPVYVIDDENIVPETRVARLYLYNTGLGKARVVLWGQRNDRVHRSQIGACMILEFLSFIETNISSYSFACTA